ncbi:MAG TPA: hypothetical protein PLY77_14510, partial [Plasticicumulans sp.]|nr:hypothetical protein [Plasticicumulans sp.]
ICGSMCVMDASMRAICTSLRGRRDPLPGMGSPLSHNETRSGESRSSMPRDQPTSGAWRQRVVQPSSS